MSEISFFSHLARLWEFAEDKSKLRIESHFSHLQDTLGLMKVPAADLVWLWSSLWVPALISSGLPLCYEDEPAKSRGTSDFKFIMSNNPMSLVLLFYAGTKAWQHQNLQIFARNWRKPPEQFKVVKNICDTITEAHDNRRLFLAYLHFLYESSCTVLLTKPSNINLVILIFAFYLSGTGLLFMISM